jgi:hypothetical protein
MKLQRDIFIRSIASSIHVIKSVSYRRIHPKWANIGFCINEAALKTAASRLGGRCFQYIFRLLIEEEEDCSTEGNNASNDVAVELNKSREGDQQEKHDHEPCSNFGRDFHFTFSFGKMSLCCHFNSLLITTHGDLKGYAGESQFHTNIIFFGYFRGNDLHPCPIPLLPIELTNVERASPQPPAK